MSLNIQELAVRFNAGMATIAIDVPPSAESRCSDRIVKEFAIPQGMRVLSWDSINSLKRWVFLNDRTPESMRRQPVEDFQVRSHPVGGGRKCHLRINQTHRQHHPRALRPLECRGDRVMGR